MTVDAMTTGTSKRPAGEAEADAQERLAAEMIKQAQEQGLALTGPDGLLGRLTKTVLETALDAEMTEHLGHAKHADQPGREGSNVRNGARTKTVVSDAVGEVAVAVPRDREGSVEPVIVKKRQRRLGSVDEIVLSLHAKGLTTGEISAHFDEIYGASVSKETVSRITDTVVSEMAEWQSRPLDEGRFLVNVANRCCGVSTVPLLHQLVRAPVA
ncbi:Transposase, Mutator family [Haloechinothrix alba]|uniref:Mutator family transposase n=1 Tax=Haloechinothrix alba TaxID=664784 RepID=A0A238YFI1_9PSEU|nr:Transposase, Mutator family [Haloechinothrix alba]